MGEVIYRQLLRNPSLVDLVNLGTSSLPMCCLAQMYFFYLNITIINRKDNVYLSKSRNFVEHTQAFVKDLASFCKILVAFRDGLGDHMH